VSFGARALAILLLASPTLASAQERRVELHLEDCLGADATAVRRIAAAELGDVLLGIERDRENAGDTPAPQTPNEEADLTRLEADCGVESAILVVSNAPRGMRLERRIDLANAAPNARTRLLALSIAELIGAGFAAIDAMPPPAPPAPEVIAEERAPPRPQRIVVRATPAPEAEPPPTRPLGIRLIGVARVSGTPVHISGGGGIGLEIGLPYMLGVGADFRYEQGRADGGPLGEVALHVAWGSLLALVRPFVGWSSLTIGLGAKLGAAWLEGVPAEGVGGGTQAGFVFGPAIAFHGALHLAGAGYVHVGLELSWITVGVSGVNGASGESIASFGGPQIAITAGFEIQPSR
jgi:hypothetical protein